MKRYKIQLEGGAVEHVDAEGFTVKNHMIHFHSGEAQKEVAVYGSTVTIEIVDSATGLPLAASKL